MQKKAIRRIYNTHYNEHTNNYFIELNALKLFDLLKYKTGSSMHKANRKLLPKNIPNLFAYVMLHTRQTGNFKPFDVRTTPKKCVLILATKVVEFP